MTNAPPRPGKGLRRILFPGILLFVVIIALFLFLKKKNPEWLGNPQSSSVMAPVCAVMRNDSGDFAITLNVAYGRDIHIPPTRNAIVTCKNGKVVQAKSPILFSDRKYLTGEIRLKEKYGGRIYICDLEITDGPLKGAVVHVRDGYVPESIPDPYFSFFEIPAGLNLAPGPVPFQIVGWSTR